MNACRRRRRRRSVDARVVAHVHGLASEDGRVDGVGDGAVAGRRREHHRGRAVATKGGSQLSGQLDCAVGRVLVDHSAGGVVQLIVDKNC